MLRTRKRIGALLAAAALVVGQLGATAYAEEPENTGKVTVTAFDGLDEAVKCQTVPAGTPLDGLTLPATLGASVYTVSADTQPVPAHIQIEGVTWEPDSPWDDTAEQGGYTFAPVLPAGYALADGVEPPEIYVRIGAPAVPLDAQGEVLTVEFNDNGSGGRNIDDNEMKTAIDAVLASVDKADIVTIKLIGDATEITGWNWKYLIDQYSKSNGWDSLTDLDLSGLTDLEAIRQDTGSSTGQATKLTKLALPDSVTEIGKRTFSGCTSLKLTELPSGVEQIGSAAFFDCTGITLNELPGKLTKIESIAFFGCTGLNLTKLPDGVKQIGDSAFRGCTGITLTGLPDKLTKIENSAFSGCTGLKLIELPDGVEQIGDSAFEDCTGITLTDLPGGVKQIGDFAFSNCKNLNLTELPSGVTQIGDNAFFYCKNLNLTELPGGVTQIGNFAFEGCTGLDDLTIPASVKSIGDYAFYDCTNLKKVTFEGKTAPSFGTGVFGNITPQPTVFVPEEATGYEGLNPQETSDLDGDGYHDGDEAAFKAILAAHPESSELSSMDNNDPESWDTARLVDWDTSNPRRITGLYLVSAGLTGTLDVGNLTELTNLEFYNNQLDTLDGLGNLTKLTYLDCSTNRLSETLDGLGKLTELTVLKCSNNQLSGTLDVGNLTKLIKLYCSYNQLSGTLDVGNLTDLQYLDCSFNRLSGTLDVGKLTDLQYLNCTSNQLSGTLDVGNLTQLEKLICDYNHLDMLDGLENLTKLTALYCNNNQLSGTLDVRNLTKLTDLYCSNNQLSGTLDVGNLTDLQYLECSNNQLTALDVSSPTNLLEYGRFSCSDNPFQSFKTSDGTLTINAGTHGIISVDSYKWDTKMITLVPKPNTGYTFGNWTVLPSGITPQDDNSLIFELNGDQEVAATFIGTDATLKALSLSAGTLTPTFDPTITAYTANVDNSVTNVTITAEANDTKAKVAGDGVHDLKVGDNSFTVTVTAEDGTPKSYTITITRAGTGTTNGNSGSSNSGGGSRHYIITTPEPPKPNNPVLAVIELPVSVGNGTATGKPDDGRTASAIAEAGKDAKAKTNGIAVQYDAKTSLSYDGFSIVISRATLDRLIAAEVKYVTLNTSIVDMTFDLAALGEIQKQATGDITLTAARETGLAGDALAAVGSRPAYRLTVNYTGADGKAATVGNFGAGRVTVGLAYQPAATEQTGGLYLVYSADGKGAEWLYQSSYDRNSGNVIASVGHFSVYAVGHRPAPAFADTVNHWAKADIDFVASRGLFSGTSETTFTPDGTTTRGMFVVALGRLAGIDPLAYPSSRFNDVAATAYYAPYVEWAASKGIVSGTGDNAFSPDAPITREQMAAIMQRYADKLGYTLPMAREAEIFADEGQITSGMKNAVQAIQQAGIMNGKGGHRFGPKDTATRAEAAAVLRRFVEIVIDPAAAGG